MKKKWFIIGGAVLIAAALSAGSFIGGMAYQRNRASQIQANFLRSRGLGGGGLPGEGANAPGTESQNASGRAFFGGGVTGQIKSVVGNVITVSTPQNVTTINLSDATKIEKSSPGSTSDLQPGEQVLVTGQRDSQGNVNASQILILNTNQQNAGTAP